MDTSSAGPWYPYFIACVGLEIIAGGFVSAAGPSAETNERIVLPILIVYIN